MDKKHLMILTALCAAGCSGGSGEPTTTIPNTGVFLDSKVEGLGYSTNTLNGTTNANGEFQYNDGESVSFSLHGQKISEVAGYNVLTPFDTNDVVNDDYAINVLSLLQTLDSDGDPTNGIKLGPITGTMNINFNQGIEDFVTDAAVIAFVSANSNAPLVSPEDALTHFSTTLASVNDGYALDITGKTATGVITAEYCDTGFSVGFDYTFGANDYEYTGIDQIISTNFTNCTAGSSDAGTENYNTFPDFALDCGPVCTYSELNRVTIGVDADGRDFITTVWHVPNSNVVTYIKRITNDINPNWGGVPYTFHEVITIH